MFISRMPHTATPRITSREAIRSLSWVGESAAAAFLPDLESWSALKASRFIAGSETSRVNQLCFAGPSVSALLESILKLHADRSRTHAPPKVSLKTSCDNALLIADIVDKQARASVIRRMNRYACSGNQQGIAGSRNHLASYHS